MIADTETAKAERAAYPSNWHYLLDELERIELLLHLQLLWEERRQSSAQPNPFKGLVLPQAEIEALLPGAGHPRFGPPGEDDARMQAATGALIELEKRILERRAASLSADLKLPLLRLSQRFNLSRFEESCLLVCLAPEIDRKYEKIYAYLQDDVTCKSPCVDLLIGLLCATIEERLAVRPAFESGGKLLKYRLLQPLDNPSSFSATLLSRSFKLDERIADFLLGSTQMDAQLDRLARLIPARSSEPDAWVAEDARHRMGQIISRHLHGSTAPMFYLFGPYGSGKRSLAKSVCYDLGLSLITCNVADLMRTPTTFDELMWTMGREALLQPAALCLENVDGLFDGSDEHRAQLTVLLETLGTFSPFTFLLGQSPWGPRGFANAESLISIELQMPDYAKRKSLWEHHLKRDDQAHADIDWQALAGRFRFTPGQIQAAAAEARTRAQWRAPDDPRITAADLYAACRAQATLSLGALARKIEPQYTWPEIILTPDELAQLGEICDQARQREKVYGEWGFNRKLSLGRSINALFVGPPGTGKTMAAEVIANELQLDLYKIDLSQIVSKYIGETEKNLHQIFKQAESSDAILFFDEADALFGKRSEVKDAHDRYANIEIAYLLQKMEEYDGIAILATNLRQNLDDAFVRRLRFIVEFPFPDEEYRRRIWEVTFPKEAPLAADVDFQRLAREIRLAGGNIKNIAVAAAFYAASDGGRIQMAQLMRAAHREHRKVGRIWNPT